MAYTPQTWTDGVSKLNATRMTVIETGISDIHNLVDAKGDLYTATAADTPARLAVGANDELLVADSAQSTGLKWANITNSMVDAAAAIAYSKLNLASSIVNADIASGAAIGISKLASYPTDATKYLRGDGTWPTLPWLLLQDIDLSSVTSFTSIASTFRSLKVIWVARTANAGTTGVMQMRFNSDSGNNYDHYQFYGANSATTSTATTAQNVGVVGNLPMASATANRFGQGEILIPGYKDTDKHKGFTSTFSCMATSAAANMQSGTASGVWLSTSAITRIDLIPSGGGVGTSGSRAQLYGLM
jgi:hypothetical protein